MTIKEKEEFKTALKKAKEEETTTETDMIDKYIWDSKSNINPQERIK